MKPSHHDDVVGSASASLSTTTRPTSSGAVDGTFPRFSILQPSGTTKALQPSRALVIPSGYAPFLETKGLARRAAGAAATRFRCEELALRPLVAGAAGGGRAGPEAADALFFRFGSAAWEGKTKGKWLRQTLALTAGHIEP